MPLSTACLSYFFTGHSTERRYTGSATSGWHGVNSLWPDEIGSLISSCYLMWQHYCCIKRSVPEIRQHIAGQSASKPRIMGNLKQVLKIFPLSGFGFFNSTTFFPSSFFPPFSSLHDSFASTLASAYEALPVQKWKDFCSSSHVHIMYTLTCKRCCDTSVVVV